MSRRAAAVFAAIASFACLPTPLRAEETPPPPAADDERAGDKPFLLRPFFSISYMGLIADQMNLEPLPLTSLGASAGWGRLKVTASKKIDLAQPDAEDLGPHGDNTPWLKSDVLDLSLAFSVPARGRELVLTPFYSRATGAQVVVDSDVEPPDSSGGYFADRFDMRLRGFGLDALYCLNPSFSYDDRLLELKPRARSSATVVLRSSLGRVDLASDGRPLGADTVWKTDRLSQVRSFGANYAGAMAGVAYQWLIVWRLSLFGMATAGGTLSSTSARLADGTRTTDLALRPTFTVNTGLAFVGYTVHFGLVTYTAREAIAVADDTVAVQRISALLFLGLRL